MPGKRLGKAVTPLRSPEENPRGSGLKKKSLVLRGYRQRRRHSRTQSGSHLPSHTAKNRIVEGCSKLNRFKKGLRIASSKTPKQKASVAEHKQIQILVAENNPGVLQTVAMMLRMSGYDGATASDGFEILLHFQDQVPLEKSALSRRSGQTEARERCRHISGQPRSSLIA